MTSAVYSTTNWEVFFLAGKNIFDHYLKTIEMQSAGVFSFPPVYSWDEPTKWEDQKRFLLGRRNKYKYVQIWILKKLLYCRVVCKLMLLLSCNCDYVSIIRWLWVKAKVLFDVFSCLYFLPTLKLDVVEFAMPHARWWWWQAAWAFCRKISCSNVGGESCVL